MYCVWFASHWLVTEKRHDIKPLIIFIIRGFFAHETGN